MKMGVGSTQKPCISSISQTNVFIYFLILDVLTKLLEEPPASIFCLDDGGVRFLQYVG